MENKNSKKIISIFKRSKKSNFKQYKCLQIDWSLLEKDIKYKVKNKQNFISALLHSSFSNYIKDSYIQSNQRLEFLGDAVLALVVGEFLFKKYPQKTEGELSKMRSFIVSEKFLSERAQELNLGKYIILGPGEEKTGGRKKVSIIVDTLEAVIGSIYLERGEKGARKFIEKNILYIYQNGFNKDDIKNYKGDLLEYCQKNNMNVPKYIMKKEEGEKHQKKYTMAVKVGNEILGVGEGKSKKEAEQKAAEMAFRTFKII